MQGCFLVIEDCVIIGGGVAGLSAANRLVDCHIKPVIIEASQYPSHRICGEFFSYECLPILKRWDISLPSQISLGRFYSGEKSFEFPLPQHSASCSRYEFDAMLLERAKQKGARVLTETSVVSWETSCLPSKYYEMQLSDGKMIKARFLIIGTGRIPKLNSENTVLPSRYYGFKAHFEGIPMDNAIEMHTFPGGYAGVSQIDEKTTNVACIVRQEEVKKRGSPEEFIHRLMNEKRMSLFKEKIEKGKMLFPCWLYGRVPEFGLRKNPSLEDVFWIGDAAGSIPPLSGDGLAIAITSGCMAADYLLKSNAQDFQKDWLKRYKNRFFFAKLLHRILLNPWMNPIAFAKCKRISFLPFYFWKLTRE